MIKVKRRFTGKECRACGRRLSLNAFHLDAASPDGHRPRCKTCVKKADDVRRELRNERARLTYAANPQEKIQKTRQYHLAHPEWSRQRLRAHHVAHRDERYERHLERGKDPQIAAARKEATRRSESRRRALKRGVLVSIISENQFSVRLAEFNGCCYICGTTLTTNLHWDHFQPLAAGGSHTISNLFPACDLCNVRKNACWPFSEQRRQEIREEVLALRARTAGLGVTAHGH